MFSVHGRELYTILGSIEAVHGLSDKEFALNIKHNRFFQETQNCAYAEYNCTYFPQHITRRAVSSHKPVARIQFINTLISPMNEIYVMRTLYVQAFANVSYSCH